MKTTKFAFVDVDVAIVSFPFLSVLLYCLQYLTRYPPVEPVSIPYMWAGLIMLVYGLSAFVKTVAIKRGESVTLVSLPLLASRITAITLIAFAFHFTIASSRDATPYIPLIAHSLAAIIYSIVSFTLAVRLPRYSFQKNEVEEFFLGVHRQELLAIVRTASESYVIMGDRTGMESFSKLMEGIHRRRAVDYRGSLKPPSSKLRLWKQDN